MTLVPAETVCGRGVTANTGRDEEETEEKERWRERERKERKGEEGEKGRGGRVKGERERKRESECAVKTLRYNTIHTGCVIL